MIKITSFDLFEWFKFIYFQELLDVFDRNIILEKKLAEMEVAMTSKQAELEEENAVLNNQVLDAILTYLESYNQTHQYASIINATSSVLVNDPSRDITKEIVDGLNAEYVKSRNNK